MNGKRKRDEAVAPARKRRSVAFQIVTGSYERILHGFTVVLPAPGLTADKPGPDLTFSDQFLFNAHASSIRCLALSAPSESHSEHQIPKRILATGGADERINLYSLATTQPPPSKFPAQTSFIPVAVIADKSSRNRELGSLTHHSSTISRLYFVSRGKLLSAAQDNTIAIARVRDWTVLSTIRAPIPKPVGRPSGDTAAAGEVPAGINDVAVHPSAKLCLSVGQGERCMRLWNLVTGKKAGVLTFEKPILSSLGEARWRGGEGRSVIWSDDGDEFAVGFEHGAVVYGLDCQVRGVARVTGTKICQIRYLPQSAIALDGSSPNIFAMSTEDGRIFFFRTHLAAEAVEEGGAADPDDLLIEPVGQLGSVSRGTRIKDFQLFDYPWLRDGSEAVDGSDSVLAVTGSSDGAVSLWRITVSDFVDASESATATKKQKPNKGDEEQALSNAEISKQSSMAVKQVGELLGTNQTGRRITCLTGFRMDQPDAYTKADGPNAAAQDGAESLDGSEEWEGLGDSDGEAAEAT